MCAELNGGHQKAASVILTCRCLSFFLKGHGDIFTTPCEILFKEAAKTNLRLALGVYLPQAFLAVYTKYLRCLLAGGQGIFYF